MSSLNEGPAGRPSRGQATANFVLDEVFRQLEEFDAVLTRKQWQALEMLHRETGQRRVHIFLAAAFLLAGFFFFGIGAQFLVNVIGFAYPAYASFKAIESTEKADDKQWLTYWVVFAAINLLETFVFLLSWVPLYYAMKMGLLLYLQLPQFQGALWVYSNMLAPLLHKHKDSIDRTVEQVAGSLGVRTPRVAAADDEAGLAPTAYDRDDAVLHRATRGKDS